MKHGKTLAEWVHRHHIRSDCILSYKQWKKRMEYDSENLKLIWRSELIRECKEIDRRIFRSHIFCISQPNPEFQLELCDMNRQSVYKLCKKLQKKLNIPAMEWYAHCMDESIRFLCSPERAVLTYTVHKSTWECPICMEHDKEWLFMRCGHHVCTQCALYMWNVHSLKGVVYNLLSIANRRANCPICRAAHPCHPSKCIVMK